MIDFEALLKVSYGIYIVSSGDRLKGNGFISNTVFQVTSDPPRFAASCNKNNFTAGLISHTGAFAVSIMDTNTPPGLYGTFGFRSGRDSDKMAGMTIQYGETGVPIILDSCLAYLEFTLVETFDLGTHLLFIGELCGAELLKPGSDPATYQFYREVKKGFSPKNAPTYIDKTKMEDRIPKPELKKYRCATCGYIYDENVEPVRFTDLPEDWECPVCGSGKSDFELILST